MKRFWQVRWLSKGEVLGQENGSGQSRSSETKRGLARNEEAVQDMG